MELSEDPRYYRTFPEDPESTTFHGRDVFAPLAAEIHEAGLEPVVAQERFSVTDSVETIEFPAPEVEGGQAAGEILVIDGFGNAITNVPGSFLDGTFGETISVDDRRVPVERTYAAVDAGEALVTVGSHGNVELAVNRGRGDRAFDVEVGDAVCLRRNGEGSSSR